MTPFLVPPIFDMNGAKTVANGLKTDRRLPRNDGYGACNDVSGIPATGKAVTGAGGGAGRRHGNACDSAAVTMGCRASVGVGVG
jgi:hypothetical protein